MWLFLSVVTCVSVHIQRVITMHMHPCIEAYWWNISNSPISLMWFVMVVYPMVTRLAGTMSDVTLEFLGHRYISEFPGKSRMIKLLKKLPAAFISGSGLQSVHVLNV